jgi:hypothetical protein
MDHFSFSSQRIGPRLKALKKKSDLPPLSYYREIDE